MKNPNIHCFLGWGSAGGWRSNRFRYLRNARSGTSNFYELGFRKRKKWKATGRWPWSDRKGFGSMPIESGSLGHQGKSIWLGSSKAFCFVELVFAVQIAVLRDNGNPAHRWMESVRSSSAFHAILFARSPNWAKCFSLLSNAPNLCVAWQFLIAIQSAFFCPINTTSRLPRVTPV